MPRPRPSTEPAPQKRTWPFWVLAFVVANGLAVAARLLQRPPPAPPPVVTQVPAPPRVDGPGYAGAQACAECHHDRFDSFSRTSHHLTSRWVDAASVAGTFDDGKATLKTGNPLLRWELTMDGARFEQTAVMTMPGQPEQRRTEHADVVVGSGKMGQSYLWWRGTQLMQLPVSWFTPGARWANSPGYPDGVVFFERPVVARCADCHATYLRELPGGPGHYAREGAVLGISCERCHGPGARHIAFHKANPDVTEARHILHPDTLDRTRHLELCAQCHAGGAVLLQPAFSFRGGKPLSLFIEADPSEKERNTSSHAVNQHARLASSRCFQQSPSMTCTTCHDPHQVERGDIRLFSMRCLECHAMKPCRLTGKRPHLDENCIDCHMARVEDHTNTFHGPDGSKAFPSFRDHLIARKVARPR